MDEVEYSCSRCRRPIKAPRAQALVLLARKRTRCQVCGADLVFPKDVIDEFEGAHKVGASDVRADVSYTCGCPGRKYKRPLGDLVVAVTKKKTTCPICSQPFAFPEEVHQAVAKLRAAGQLAREAETSCPICDRTARGDGREPDKVLKCGYCGARFLLPGDGPGCRLLPVEGAAATVEQVQKSLEKMPGDEIGRIVSQALLARAARGEVAKGEAKRLAELHAAIAEWDPNEREECFLPLEEAEAEKVVPALLFPGMVAYRDYPGGVLELVFTIGQSTGLTDQGKLKAAVNVIGVVTLFAAGGGFFMTGGDDTRAVQHRLRVSVTESGGGVVLGLSHQVDDGTPKLAGKKELAAFREQIKAIEPALRCYYALAAVYGPWAEGTPCVAATESAIEKRLVALGDPLAKKAGQVAPKLRVVLQ